MQKLSVSFACHALTIWSVFLQLDQLTGHMAELQQQVADKGKLEAALKDSEQARLEAQEQLRQVREESFRPCGAVLCKGKVHILAAARLVGWGLP
jgi:hypothetical protein